MDHDNGVDEKNEVHELIRQSVGIIHCSKRMLPPQADDDPHEDHRVSQEPSQD